MTGSGGNSSDLYWGNSGGDDASTPTPTPPPTNIEIGRGPTAANHESPGPLYWTGGSLPPTALQGGVPVALASGNQPSGGSAPRQTPVPAAPAAPTPAPITQPTASPGASTVLGTPTGKDLYLATAMKHAGVGVGTPNAYSILNPNDPRLHVDEPDWLAVSGPTDEDVKNTACGKPPKAPTDLPKWVLEAENLGSQRYFGTAPDGTNGARTDLFEITLPIFTCTGGSQPNSIVTNFEMYCILLRAQRWLVRVYARVYKPEDPCEVKPQQIVDMLGHQTLQSYRRNASMHGSGSAIDVDPGPSPYFISRTKDGRNFGGENHTGVLSDFNVEAVPAKEGPDKTHPTNQADIDATMKRNATRRENARAALTAMQKACAEVCDRAHQLFYDAPADLEAEPFNDVTPDPGCSAQPKGSALVAANLKAYDRLIRIHWCLVMYFDRTHCTGTKATLDGLRKAGGIHPNHPASAATFGAPKPAGDPGDFDAFAGRVAADMEILKFGMVHGDLQFAAIKTDANGVKYPKSAIPFSAVDPGDNTPYELICPRARDPRAGILSHSRLLIDALSRVGLGWGAVDFTEARVGGEHGDMMHFDLRCHFGKAIDEPEKLSTDTTARRGNDSQLASPCFQQARARRSSPAPDALSAVALRDAILGGLKAWISPDVPELRRATIDLEKTLNGYKATIDLLRPSVPQRTLAHAEGAARKKLDELKSMFDRILGASLLSEVRDAVKTVNGFSSYNDSIPGHFELVDTAVKDVKRLLDEHATKANAAP